MKSDGVVGGGVVGEGVTVGMGEADAGVVLICNGIM